MVCAIEIVVRKNESLLYGRFVIQKGFITFVRENRGKWTSACKMEVFVILGVNNNESLLYSTCSEEILNCIHTLFAIR